MTNALVKHFCSNKQVSYKNGNSHLLLSLIEIEKRETKEEKEKRLARIAKIRKTP